MDVVKIMLLKKFFEILENDGKEAAIKFAEDTTGQKIDREDEEAKEKPSLHVVD